MVNHENQEHERTLQRTRRDAGHQDGPATVPGCELSGIRANGSPGTEIQMENLAMCDKDVPDFCEDCDQNGDCDQDCINECLNDILEGSRDSHE